MSTEIHTESEYLAEKIYTKQKKAILSMRGTEWFNEIIKYFEIEIAEIHELLTICKTDDLLRLQWRYEYANWFLTFLKERGDL